MKLAQNPVRFAFLGCGHMGKALLGAILPSICQTGSPISEITVVLNRKESEARLQQQFRDSPNPVKFVSRQNIQAVRDADAILFAFPPCQIHHVLGTPEMREALRHKLIISILARTPSADVLRLLQGDRAVNPTIEDTQIIRAMPTIGTAVHESATLIAEPGASTATEALELATWVFNLVGKVFHVSDDYFDTATGMSAFCNALTTVATQAITQKALAEGVPMDHAIAITSQCIRGSVSLMLSGASPQELQQSLSAPGSITEHAISGLSDSQMPVFLQSVLSATISKARNGHAV